MSALVRLAGLGPLLCLSACAWVVNGSTQQVVVTSEPSGAVLTIDSAALGYTPAVVALPRKSRHTVTVALPGYAPDTLQTRTRAGYGLLAGDLLLFHPIGVAIGLGTDLLTGAHRRVDPALVNFVLVRSEGGPAGISDRAPVPWQPAPIGSLLRVSLAMGSSAPKLAGRLESLHGDTLLLIGNTGSVTHRVPRPAMTSLELAVGADPARSFTRWIPLGALVGVSVLGAAGTIAHGAEGAYYWGLLYGLPAGALAGSIAGAVFAPPPRWLRLY